MSWASGGALNNVMDYVAGGGGDRDDAIGFGDDTTRNRCQSYNGTTWTTENNLPTSTRTNGLGGGGGSADAICFGGNFINPAIEFDGTNWASGGNLTSAATGSATDCGTSTDAIRISGSTSYWNDIESCEEYNGTSWSSGGSVSVGAETLAGGGNTTDAICFGGEVGSTSQTRCEEYNGTSWSAGGDIGAANTQLGGGGNSTDAISIGGYVSAATSSQAQTYNGSTWTTIDSLITARRWYGGITGGSSTNAFCSGGNGASGTLTSTEEWTEAIISSLSVRMMMGLGS